ncbi:MAG: regulatory protein GemA [Martelella sp.]|uniref:regulatory protein GemA n=1 Tax=Martelella sp. TaxID=1969699 RepID=UPI0032429EF7
MTAHKTIYAVANKLGLDDDARRSIYERVTGKPKLTLMSDSEKQAVADEFKRLGGDRRPDGRLKLTGPYAGKLQALWIAAWNLGIVDNRDDAALLAFVKRQTGIDHTRFLANAADAKKAIEALKIWVGREGGVDWSTSRFLPDWTQVAGYRISQAQAKKLGLTDRQFSEEIWREAGKYSFSLTRDEWVKVMNSLGKMIRDRKAGAS